MVKILLYGYASGIPSSRQIDKKLHEDVGFRVPPAGTFPSHRTMAESRQRYLKEISQLFVRLVETAREAGVLKLGTVAVDGTKVKGNASKREAIVEPVAGWIKEILGFRPFSLRGLWSGCRENGTWCAQPST